MLGTYRYFLFTIVYDGDKTLFIWWVQLNIGSELYYNAFEVYLQSFTLTGQTEFNKRIKPPDCSHHKDCVSTTDLQASKMVPFEISNKFPITVILCMQ